jgi:hypothetical protein
LCLLATFLVDSRGTKKGIHTGAALTIIGKFHGLNRYIIEIISILKF